MALTLAGSLRGGPIGPFVTPGRSCLGRILLLDQTSQGSKKKNLFGWVVFEIVPIFTYRIFQVINVHPTSSTIFRCCCYTSRSTFKYRGAITNLSARINTF